MPIQRRLTLIAVLLLLGLAVSIRPFTTQARPALASLHLTLGNPSGAVSDPAFPANYLIDRPQYALAYQRDAGIPAWVSWHLETSDLGGASRGSFVADGSLPAGWYPVQPGDYTGSGYDRGHMTPSGDRTSSRVNNDATFIMSNIIPQAPDNNQGPWAALENYCRGLLQNGYELYIISGGSGSLGTLAGGKLQIPAVTWKVIVVLPVGDNDASRVTESTRVIGIWMPNVQGIRSTPWEDFRVSVDSIEAQTGFNFLSEVAEPAQSIVEAQVDGSSTTNPTATPASPTAITFTPTAPPTATATVSGTVTPATATATAPTATPSATGQPSGESVVISQVYGGGGNSGALASHDFIEIFNRGGSAVSLSGWSVQYASSGGTTWQTTNLPAVTLLPGQYLLVRESAGAACSSPCVPLPQPDAIGNIAMSGTSGKVVLAASTTAFSGACPIGGAVRDRVGYGSAGCFEGPGAAPTLDAATAALRLGGGCVDTDHNAADLTAAAPAPRTMSSPLNACDAGPTPTSGSPTATLAASLTPTAQASTTPATTTAGPSATASATVAASLTPTAQGSATPTATTTAGPSATATSGPPAATATATSASPSATLMPTPTSNTPASQDRQLYLPLIVR
jgi:endonuclease G